MTQADAETLSYYERNAGVFVTDTSSASMHDALLRFATLLSGHARVLDWGCGSGRDSLEMRELGLEVTSVDASPSIAAAALAATGTVVRVESFDNLSEVGAYDGVWACASLLHVRPEGLPTVLGKAADALLPGGILYCSFKHGRFAGQRDGRWFTDLDERSLSNLLAPRFEVIEMWASPDVRPGRGDQTWLNCLATKR